MPQTHPGPGRSLLGALRAPFAALLVLCFVAAAPAPPTVGRIAVRGAYLLSAEQIAGSLGVRQGAALDRQRLQQAVDRWNASGVYGTLSFQISPAEGGRVELTILADERVQVTAVGFEGNEAISARRLAELVGVEPWDVVTPIQAQAHERQIVRAYREKGYRAASARAAVRVTGPDSRELVFVISEGPQCWVQAIRFEGNEHVPADELRKIMHTRPRGFIRWIWPGWFDEDTFQQDVQRVQAAYRDRGYLDAQATGYVDYSPDMSRATLRVVVDEGDLYRIGRITFEGNTIFRDSELLDAVRLRPGEPCRMAVLESAPERIGKLYAAQGYMDATPRKNNVRMETIFPKVGTDVSVRFTIVEGKPVFIRRVVIRGLEKTREDVVRRNLTFYPGERASSEKLLESERALANTGYFDRQSRRPVRITLEPDQGALRDAVVTVKEGSTGWFMVGVGAGSESGLLGQISISEDNFDISNWPSSWNDFWRGNAFRGGGQKFSVMLSSGTRRSYYAVDFLDPSVRNSDYSFGASIYSRGTARNEFDETRTGVSVSGGQRLSEFARRTLTVGYESVRVENVDPTDAPDLVRDEGTHSKPFIRLGYSLDRRDDRFLPSSGYVASVEVELAGGDTQTVKLDVQGRKYYTVRQDRGGTNKHIVGIRGRVGLVEAYSGDVPVYERFYAGGFSTLRGFQFEGVSPVDKVTRQQIGGQCLVAGGVDYSLPITEDEQLRLITFTDAGYVGEELGDLFSGISDLRLSVGVGLAWRAPLFGGTPIELDLAVPLLRESEDDTRNVHFSIGAFRRF